MGRQQQRRKQRQRQSQRVRQNRGATPPPAQPRRQVTRRPWWGIAAGITLFLVVAGVAVGKVLTGSGAPATPTPGPSVGSAVDGIQCQTMEQGVYHIHQYVELYDHGKRVHLPNEIGIPVDEPGNEFTAVCLYWIHVHASDTDIIHVESPIHKTFTFGNFLDIWKATYKTATPSSDAFVKHLEKAPKSQIHVFVNGKVWTKGYRKIPLKSHAVIAVEIGKPVVPWQPFTAWYGL